MPNYFEVILYMFMSIFNKNVFIHLFYSQDKVCELYEFLHGTGNTDVVSKLEAVIINVINDIRAYKRDGERLEALFQR